ncbi:cation:proton antiporter regulatory subunit [Caldalkalibacillus mannanilyticus]|uniref:cation:proton antiporter regulatory subunit n=1 Tax=Caldalkalibacillus mannanilyticus TaxID=1418 RepID=UPI00046A2838|nr:cation:proton antiporter regulatory subunit [Caldalkalibacillus mannanilyticus]
MKIKMSDLPGVGKKFSFITAEENMMVLIIHHTGKRELHLFDDADDDEPAYTINLNSEETKEIAAQMLGATYQPVDVDTMKTFKNKLLMEWVELKEDSPIVGKTLIESDIRAKTGATVIAIVRGEEVVASPDPTEKLKAGDTLMAAGNSEQMKAFEQLCQEKGEV